jgi:hypothetical protein
MPQQFNNTQFYDVKADPLLRNRCARLLPEVFVTNVCPTELTQPPAFRSGFSTGDSANFVIAGPYRGQ